MSTIDTILPALYQQFDVPADRLVTDPQLGDRFADLVRGQMPGMAIDKGLVLRRLITLRKRGLLPRIRR